MTTLNGHFLMKRSWLMMKASSKWRKGRINGLSACENHGNDMSHVIIRYYYSDDHSKRSIVDEAVMAYDEGVVQMKKWL